MVVCGVEVGEWGEGGKLRSIARVASLKDKENKTTIN